MRSRTAETIWNAHPDLSVRSAGTNASAVRTVSVDHMQWADVILVMEQHHKDKLTDRFPSLVEGMTIHVLEIPDIYRYMDPFLMTILEKVVPDHLKL
ncbi:hypothetical protein [Kiloniella sp.]|uniref:hypothetical protein n=1 Tax=Kiloniella sp. TaxID=1938587 RepID=UPI003B02DE00